MRKHSVSIRGHRTSFSLEPEFLTEVRRIASDRGVSLAALAAEIDAARSSGVNLSSALRLLVLADLKTDSGRKGREPKASPLGRSPPAGG